MTKIIKESNHHLWKGGKYKENGYLMVKVDTHPRMNSRGYVAEHRLVIEKNIGRYLSDDEVIHHINGIRDDNRLENLEIKTDNATHISEHKMKRNPNGKRIANEPVFEDIKFRLFDSDRGITQIYTLSKLIGTTFRRGKFNFRGRYTGLKDKNGKEIYEGDIVKVLENIVDMIVFDSGCFCLSKALERSEATWWGSEELEVIGNIYENGDLIK